jgi:sugar/nucleoside kinase (ribokinase family)
MIDVITVGTATRDVFLRSDLFRMIRDPEHLKKLGFPMGEAECFALGGKIDIEKPVFTIGGGATNAAVTFARQGFKTMCVAKVGEDLTGRLVEQDLVRENIRPALFKDKKNGTGYSTLLLSPQGERTALVYRGASQDITEKELSSLTENARFVYIVPGKIPFTVILDFAKRAKKSGACVAINPSGFYLEMGLEKLSPLFNLMDVVLLNKDEASKLTETPIKKEDKIFQIFYEHITGIAIMSDGANGVSISNGHTVFQAAVFSQKEIVDRTGAGDAFGSGFVAGLLRSQKAGFSNEDIEFGIRLGSANATSVIEYIGAQEGILTAKDFANPRWKYLPITKRTI